MTTDPPKPALAVRVAFVVAAAAMTLWLGVRVAQAVSKKVAALPMPSASSAPSRERQGTTGKVELWQPEVVIEGTLVPFRETDLSFTIPGRLAHVHVKTGALVREGQPLAQLDGSLAHAQLRAAEAQLKAAAAQLELAEDQRTRTEGLVLSGTLPEAQGVATRKQVDLIAAQVEAARAQRDLARATLAQGTLVAPFSGTITSAPSARGAVVQPGMPLFHLVDATKLRLVGTVRDDDARLLAAGQAVEVVVQSVKLTGTLTAVLPAADMQTRRVRVEAEFQNLVDRPVVAGSLARAVVRGAEKREVIRLPLSVVKPGTQDEVYVQQDAGWVKRRVALTVDGDSVLVHSGLSARETVLLSPPPVGAEP